MEIRLHRLSPKYRFQLDSIYAAEIPDLRTSRPSFSLNFTIKFLLHFESKLENFVGNLAVISETREEASFEVRFESFLRLTCRVFRKDRRAFGDRSEGKRFDTVSWSTRDRLSGRLWFSLVRLSMFRHLFIDLLEYGGVWVLSMLNFYSSCLRPYFGKVLDYDNMSLDIIEYPYLVGFDDLLPPVCVASSRSKLHVDSDYCGSSKKKFKFDFDSSLDEKSMGFIYSSTSWILKTNSEELGAKHEKMNVMSIIVTQVNDIMTEPVAMGEQVDSLKDLLLAAHFKIDNVKDVSKETGVDVAQIHFKLDQIMKEAIKIATKVQAG
ncbi:hypothetical protein H5410_056701 [Solanum commersonii]|uniref:Uncharacterized protein n=1 Tax=Solanum commersonii TaxID=4109 RepID=A0A9J5WN02_SOLCO|nr:hypothetical protein H5410_056701 [Solanum commersonii]